VVETSQPKLRFIRRIVHFYLKHITVPVGTMISGHRGAYHYLAHSAVNYADADGVQQILLDAGFSKVEYQLQLGGVAGIWQATK
jgi:demethylmenaquinone methyltransferase / 2-methoxy-6-polyprenyl-1,4-benzoquinol methylase